MYVELASELEITKALTFLKLMNIPKVMNVHTTGGLPISNLYKHWKFGLGKMHINCLETVSTSLVPFLFPLFLGS